MGMFKSKEEKNEELIEKYIDRYNLDELDHKDLETIKRITTDLGGNALGKAGMALSFANLGEQMKVSYLSALVEQNWMIIRQLSKLTKELEKMNNK